MIFLFILTAINALLNNTLVVSDEMRVVVAGFPINIIDFGILLALVGAMLPKGDHFFALDRVHKAQVWVFAIMAVASVGAFVGSMGNGANVRQISTAARNLIEVPILAYLGYRHLARPKSAVTFCYLIVFAGVCAASRIIFTFRNEAEVIKDNADIMSVRVVQFVSNYAGLASALLLFSVASGVKPLFKPWFAVLLAGFCYVGQFASFSRSDWLAMTGGIIAGILVIPRYGLGHKVVFGFIATVVISTVVGAAVFLASSVTGKNVGAKLADRVVTMLPGEHEGVKAHAWDTRVHGAMLEVQMWIRSPIIGRGFAIDDVQTDDDKEAGLRHNSWTSTLAESGLIGFTGFAIIAVAQIVVGRRMVRDNTDRGSVLLGGAGVITGVHYILHGYCTMSFNQVRWAIPMALTFGAVMRCRMMQQAIQAATVIPEEQVDEFGGFEPSLLEWSGGSGL